MKKAIMMLAVIAFIYLFGSPAAYKEPVEAVTAYRDAFVVVLKDRIHPSMPIYLFKVYGFKRDGLYSTSKIEILDQDRNTLIQTLVFDPTQTPDGVNLGLVMEDMNFDGYKDIRIQAGLPAAPNIPYIYWLWNQENKQFVRDKELEGIPSPEFNEKTKTILSFVRDNAVTYFERYYRYIDSHPRLVREIQKVIDPGKNVVHIIIRELKNDNMKIVEQYDEPLE